jgi:hypothetical protein
VGGGKGSAVCWRKERDQLCVKSCRRDEIQGLLCVRGGKGLLCTGGDKGSAQTPLLVGGGKGYSGGKGSAVCGRREESVVYGRK